MRQTSNTSSRIKTAICPVTLHSLILSCIHLALFSSAASEVNNFLRVLQVSPSCRATVATQQVLCCNSNPADLPWLTLSVTLHLAVGAVGLEHPLTPAHTCPPAAFA